MARKKAEIRLQVEIETQEEWEEMLAKEGVTVVDVYQEWAGPCKAMVSNFRKLKNELGDDLLRFAVAKCDTVDALERYRGRCQPCFLFYAGGVLVFVQRGAQVPSITKAIHEELVQEHKVLDGSAERKEVTDPVLDGQQDSDRLEDEEDDDDESSEGGGEIVHYEELPEVAESKKRGVTLAILKPNVVKAGKVDEIIVKMKEHGIEILQQEERTLTKEEAEEFYVHKKDEEYFDRLCDFMSSGPSVVLVLSKGETGEDIIDEWRDLLGPANVEEAKENAPDSLRALFGEESFVNAVHGSDSGDVAMQELAFFFPNYTIPEIPATGAPKHRIQRTLALIRPDTLRERKDEILEKIEEAGFIVAMQKEVQLSQEQAEEFYKEHKDQPYFQELVTQMTNGPLLALALAREDAVTGWRELLGPKEVDVAKEEAPESLRAQFAVEDVPINQLHGSDSENAAQEELSYFFPMQQTLAAIKPDGYQTRDEIMNKIKEAGFHVAARKETEVTPEVAKQFYSDLQDKEYFDDLVQHMTSGPTLFMVLSREDAVEGWRGLLGPTDPTIAKEEAPESLRAQFGTDIKANAIHGSSTTQEAKTNMELVFGEMEFNPDGTLKVWHKKGEEGEEAAQREESEDAAQQEEAAPAEKEAAPADAQAADEETKPEEAAKEVTTDDAPKEEVKEQPEMQQPPTEDSAPAEPDGKSEESPAANEEQSTTAIEGEAELPMAEEVKAPSPAPGTPAPTTPTPTTPTPEAAAEETPAAAEETPAAEDDKEKPTTPAPDGEQKTEDA